MHRNLRPYRQHWPRVHPTAYVDPSALLIGRVSLARDASIWPFAVARGDVHRIEIGARTNIQDGAVLHVTHDGPYTPGGSPLLIGDDVTVGHGAILHACKIGDLCLIGMGATVLDDADLGRAVFIGAGALVPPGKRLQPGSLWVGNPARFVRYLADAELDRLEYSSKHYVRLKNEYLAADQTAPPAEAVDRFED